MTGIIEMDLTDWVLCAAVTGLMAFAFGMLIPKFGIPIGAALAIYALYRAKNKRDKLKEQPENKREKHE